MKVLKLTAQCDVAQLHQSLQNASSLPEFKRLQVLYLTATYVGVTGEFLSEITGLSAPSVYLIVQRFNKEGGDSITSKPRGGRRRSLLTVEQEIAMMRELEAKATQGVILTAYDIRKHVEQEVGRVVSDDFLWDLFKRNRWVKRSPRPEHPKKNEKAQEQFKKNSRTIWLPLQLALESN
jgi:transposase